MRLLKYENYNITFEPALLTLKVFKKLHDRDKTKDKSKFISELGYIYFMEDPRSDYQYITDYEERMQAVIEGEGLGKDFGTDPELVNALNYYAKFKPTSALLLEDTRIAVSKLRKLLREIDLEQTDDKGKPVYTLNVVTSTIKQVPLLIKDLDEAERSIAKEIVQNENIRGKVEKNIFEDL